MTRKSVLLMALFLPIAFALGAASQGPERTVNCRAMEVFTAKSVGATAVVFHQRDSADAQRLGELLRAQTGEEVKFQTADGLWHRATVGRVKSCFGRGLLLFASSETKLAAREDFVLRFAPGTDRAAPFGDSPGTLRTARG